MFAAHLVHTEDEIPTGIPRLRVGFTEQKYPLIVANILIEQNSRAVLAIYVAGHRDDYFFKESVLVWNTNVVVGVGHQVTFVNLSTHAHLTFDLGGYFGQLYPANERILVASQCHLRCFTDGGRLVWTSPILGVDGVVVDAIQDEKVEGFGNWDPPYPWRPFKLSLASGQLLS